MLDYVRKSQLASKEECLIMGTLNELKSHIHIRNGVLSMDFVTR